MTGEEVAEALNHVSARLEAIEATLARIENEGLAPRTPIPRGHLEAILAAIAAVLPNQQVLAVGTPGDIPMNLWSFQGRMVTFHSHQTRSGWRR